MPNAEIARAVRLGLIMNELYGSASVYPHCRDARDCSPFSRSSQSRRQPASSGFADRVIVLTQGQRG